MRTYILTIAVLASAFIAASADGNDFKSYITLGWNDTVTVPRSKLGDRIDVNIRARFDGKVEKWTANLSYPDGIVPLSVEEGPEDLDVEYIDSNGVSGICRAYIAYNQDLTTVNAGTTTPTYCPYGGGYYPNGMAKWPAGDYGRMATLTLFISSDFGSVQIAVSGVLTGNDLTGGAVGSAMYSKTVTIVVESAPGDVNCDGEVNITDAIELINYLLNDEGDISLDAADMNNDGEVNITDAIDLINYILNN